MELQQHPEEKENALKLADRKSLFQLLTFLDQKPPQYYGIQMLVRTALYTDDPLYRIYFRRNQNDSQEEDPYSVIIGARMVPLEGPDHRPTKKFWYLSSWIADEGNLPKAYDAIKEIDWINDGLFTHYQTYITHPAVAKFLNSKRGSGRKELQPVPFSRLVLPVKTALSFEISYPDNVYVKSLERCHAQLIYDNWSFKAFSTVKHLAWDIDQLPSVGVFLKENDQLVTWAMCHSSGGMARLFTMENYRRRGYAKLAIQYLSKRCVQAGCIPYVHVLANNEISRRFFENLGFELGCPCNDYHLNPSSSSDYLNIC